MSSMHIDLDNTLGAAFIGNIVAGVLYGVTCLQTFNYYKKGQGDHVAFRIVIYSLWILDTLHLALVTQALYFYLIKNYNHPVVLLSPTWSIISQVFVTCISDLAVRIIYGRRVWKISHNPYIIGLITIAATGAFGGGFAFAIEAFVQKTFANFSRISYLMYLALGSAVAADVLIASSLCLSLSRSRTGFKKLVDFIEWQFLANSLRNLKHGFNCNHIDVICGEFYVILGVLTTLCSAACLITYTVWPRQFTFIGIYVCLSKLFLNSLLAMLNGRKALKKRVHGLSSSRAHFSGASSKPVEFQVTSFMSKETYQTESPPSPMVINVSTEVQTRHHSVV